MTDPSGTVVIAAATGADRRVRVAQVITGLVLGGGGQFMSAFARNLDRASFKMDVYCVLEGGEQVDYIRSLGIAVEILPIGRDRGLLRYDIARWAALAARLRRGRYDIVHTHLFRADLIGGIAAFAARRRVIIKTLHNMGTRKRKYHKTVDSILNTVARRIVCVSDSQKRVTIERDGADPDKVVTIRNGVCLDRFRPSVDRRALAISLGLDPSRPIVGTVGRLVEEKGHRFLIQAIPEIARRCPGVQFLIVGGGSLHGELDRQIAQSGVCDVVITGLRPDVPELLAIMDVFAFPSLSEGSPIAALEAMASGVPIACSDIPALAEIVSHGETALMFRTMDPVDLANAVCRLLGDAGLHKSLSRRALGLVQADYSEAAMVRAYEALYRAEIARSGAC